MALILAGLEIVDVDEQDDLPWALHPAMNLEGEPYVVPDPWREQVPAAWSLVTRKPGPRHHPPRVSGSSGANRVPGRRRGVSPVGGEACPRSGVGVRG
jgi:hypothetical protein